MLSERAQRYLSRLKRITPVPTEEVRRVLERQGTARFPVWLDFHERYAGYVEPQGLDTAVLGIVHARSHWIKPGAAAVSRSYEASAEWFVTCAEAHPSYVYELGDTGFFRAPAAASFEMALERHAARVEFSGQPRAKSWLQLRQWPPSPTLIEQLKRDARVVPEGSDAHYRLWLGERFYALQDATNERFIDGFTHE
jgi:hypothetical protein